MGWVVSLVSSIVPASTYQREIASEKTRRRCILARSNDAALFQRGAAGRARERGKRGVAVRICTRTSIIILEEGETDNGKSIV